MATIILSVMKNAEEKNYLMIGSGIKLTGIYQDAFKLAVDVLGKSRSGSAVHIIEYYLDQKGYTEKAAQMKERECETDMDKTLSVAA